MCHEASEGQGGRGARNQCGDVRPLRNRPADWSCGRLFAAGALRHVAFSIEQSAVVKGVLLQYEMRRMSADKSRGCDAKVYTFTANSICAVQDGALGLHEEA